MHIRLQFDHPEEYRKARLLWEHCFPEDEQSFIDWYFDSMYRPEHVLGVYEGDELLAGLHMNPFDLSIRGHSIPASTLTGVGTYAEHRHHGYAKALIAESFAVMRDRGQMLSFLLPSHEGFYQSVGFESCYEMLTCTWIGRSINSSPAEAVLPELHACELLSVYRKAMEGCSGYVIRNEQTMIRRLQDHASDGGILIRAWRQGECCGYALIHDDEEERFVDEWAAVSLGYNNTFDAITLGSGGKISCQVPVSLQEKIPIYNTMCVKSQGAMLRIVDFQAFCTRMVHPKDNILVKVNDPICGWNDATWSLGGVESAVQRSNMQPDATADIGTWTGLLTGAISVVSALSKRKLFISNQKAENVLLDWLKPIPMVLLEKY